MMSYRVEKVASTLKSALGMIFLNKMSDPDFRTVSVSRVDLSRDLKNAKIYVSSFEVNSDDLIDKLKTASGYIRRELSGSVYMKFIPKLEFIYDSAYEFNQKPGEPETF